MDERSERQKQFTPPTIGEKGKKVFIYMADFEGHYKRLKTYFHSVLILFYLLLPWVYINGNQFLLLDIPNRRFNIFGITLWAHDGPLIIFILAGLALSLAFITAIWGRVWCGWACPQTVFLDTIFRRIERFVEGKHKAREKLHNAPMSFDKFKKLMLKWGLYILTTMIITHSFLAYFVGSNKIFHMITSSPYENPIAFIFTFVTSALILINFAWFREQMCLIVCPYGRFQSVLMDEKSMAVAYDEKRGEPRRVRGQKSSDDLGDCVDCHRCIEVCPTGIDIRKGIQMECLACTNCIDACDTVMEKFNKPKGLISYTSLHELEHRKKPSAARPRTLVYLMLIVGIGSGLVFALSKRGEMRIDAIRAIESPYQQLELNGTKIVINHFKFRMHNQSRETKIISIKPKQEFIEAGVEFTTALPEVSIQSGQSQKVDVFVKFPLSVLKNGKSQIHAEIYENQDGIVKKIAEKDLTIVGPLN